MEFKNFKTNLGTYYLGRCEDVIRELEPGSFDLILTDPPYGIEYTGRSKERDHKRDAIANDKIYDTKRLFRSIYPLMSGLLKENAEIYTFVSGYTKNRALLHIEELVNELIGIDGWIIWDKKKIGFGQDWRNQYEVILQSVFGEGLNKDLMDRQEELIKEMVKLAYDKGLIKDWEDQYEVILQSVFGDGLAKANRSGNVISLPRVQTSGDDHPTTKPYELMHKIISIKKPTRVLDPFAGSGGVAIACERLGIEWVCCDLEEKWFKLAKEKIMAENAQEKLF